MVISIFARPVLARRQSGHHSRLRLFECPKQLTRVTLYWLVYLFPASASNLLFHCFVRDLIQDNGVCNVLNETEIVANVCKARLRGMAINYFGRSRCLQHYRYSKCLISGNNVNVDGIGVIVLL